MKDKIILKIKCPDTYKITEVSDKLKKAAEKLDEVNSILSELTSSNVELKLVVEV